MSAESQKAMLKQLKEPFDLKFVKWRVGATNADKTKGIALPYIDSREVMKRLDDVCGLGNWRNHQTAIDGGFVCELDIKIDGEWVTRSNAAGNTHVEPIKGGASDAFKRAASTWGIGRYLYYLPNVWVAIKPQGKSYVLAELPELPEWALPSATISRWEDVAEMELDASASADIDEQQEIAATIITNIDKIRGAATIKELQDFSMTLDQSEIAILSVEINTKTQELLGGNPKT
jgi:hypothetical protein